MKDVLENLAKLPPACAAVMQGRKVYISRGARDPVPLSTPVTVDQWNAQHGVTPAQVKAMIVGVTLGWDMDGADPDTHADATDEEKIGSGPFSYTYAAEIEVSVTVEAMCEVEAAKLARERLQQVSDNLLTFAEDMTCSPSDTMDILESTDPREQ